MPPGDVRPPLYAQIADDLRRRIATGDLQPGAQLPAENTLRDDWATTRPTVQRAYDVLKSEGLIVSQPGRGRFVRERPALKFRSPSHHRRHKTGEEPSAFARDAAREGAAPSWDSETTRVRAMPDVAERLNIAEGDYVMRTSYVFHADGQPVQTSTSWEPFALTGGTAIEEPEAGDGPRGVVARMDSIGVLIDRVVEVVRARPSLEAERVVLRVPDDVWMQEVQRTYYAGERAVETADIVIPADRYLLRYEIEVPLP